jgi:hypothetical protein
VVDFETVELRDEVHEQPLSPAVGARVIVRLMRQKDDELEVSGPVVVEAAIKSRRLYLAAAPLLVRLCSVMGTRRARLFHAGVAILAGDTGAAVPEPSTWALSALLAGGAAFTVWRKRQKALKEAA